jgi:endonuclease/exonuclease/phosphatase (EEP) superfamily protein YafD
MRTGRSGSTSRRIRLLASSAAAAAVVVTGGVAPATAAPAAERAEDHSIRVITYNVGDKSPETLRAQLDRLLDLRPAVLGLQEVSDRQTLLKNAARAGGYRLFHPERRLGKAHNAILVRRNVTVLASGVTLLTEPARVEDATPGTGDGNIAARKWVNWVRIKTDGLRWTAGVVHLVPSAERLGGLTRKHHLKQVARCAEWWKNVKVEPLLMGDFNATLGHRYNLLEKLRMVAKPWTKPSIADGRAIDYVWSKKNASGTVKALRGFGGDHKPVQTDLRVTR